MAMMLTYCEWYNSVASLGESSQVEEINRHGANSSSDLPNFLGADQFGFILHNLHHVTDVRMVTKTHIHELMMAFMGAML